MKYFIILILAFYCIAFTNATDQLFGVINPTDVLLARETITKKFRLGGIVSKDYTFVPPAGGPYTINGIKVIDNKKFKGSTATLTSAALPTTTATINFKSKRGGGINSIIEVYGTA